MIVSNNAPVNNPSSSENETVHHQYFQNPCIVCGKTHFRQQTTVSGTLMCSCGYNAHGQGPDTRPPGYKRNGLDPGEEQYNVEREINLRRKQFQESGMETDPTNTLTQYTNTNPRGENIAHKATAPATLSHGRPIKSDAGIMASQQTKTQAMQAAHSRQSAPKSGQVQSRSGQSLPQKAQVFSQSGQTLPATKSVTLTGPVKKNQEIQSEPLGQGKDDTNQTSETRMVSAAYLQSVLPGFIPDEGEKANPEYVSAPQFYEIYDERFPGYPRDGPPPMDGPCHEEPYCIHCFSEASREAMRKEGCSFTTCPELNDDENYNHDIGVNTEKPKKKYYFFSKKKRK